MVYIRLLLGYPLVYHDNIRRVEVHGHLTTVSQGRILTSDGS